MTYREYLQSSDFDEVWKCLTSDFAEDEALRGDYEHLFEAVKKLSANPSNEVIVISQPTKFSKVYATNMLDCQEELVDRKVSPDSCDMGMSDAEVAALLLYCSSMYGFKTLTEERERIDKYWEAMEWKRSYPGELFPYNLHELIPIGERSCVTNSRARKRLRFWEDAIFNDYAGEYAGNLEILRKKLEYNIGYFKSRYGYPGTERNKLDIDRMETARELIRIVANDALLPENKYVNVRNASRYKVRLKDWETFKADANIFASRLYIEKAYQLLWPFLARNMKMWHDD